MAQAEADICQQSSDLFHENLTDGQILRVFDVMARCPRHTFQILTKRPDRMYEWMQRWRDTKEADYQPKLARGPEATRKAHTCGRALMFASMLESMGNPPPGCAYPTYDWLGGMCRWPNTFHNVWLGVSIEDQKTADARIPLLLQTPATKRFISAEPLLGPVDFTEFLFSGSGRLNRLHQIIVGGESGPSARPLDLAWSSVDDAIGGYVRAFDSFLRNSKFIPVLESIEKPLYCEQYDFCGTPDVVGTWLIPRFNQQLVKVFVVLDWKTGMMTAVRYQLAAYAHALGVRHRAAVKLNKDGTYSMAWFKPETQRQDLDVFLRALETTRKAA